MKHALHIAVFGVIFTFSSATMGGVPVPPVEVQANGSYGTAIGINYGPMTSYEQNISVIHRATAATMAEQEKWARAQRTMLQINNPTTLTLNGAKWQE